MTDAYMMVRNTDPDTSHAAAESFTPAEMETLVLNAISKFPDGCIADDIEAMFPHIRSHSITPRFAPLLRSGCIVDTGERRMANSKRGQRVVKFVPEPERVPFIPSIKKEWVRLTEEEVKDFQVNNFVGPNLIRAIERRIKEKNT